MTASSLACAFFRGRVAAAAAAASGLDGLLHCHPAFAAELPWPSGCESVYWVSRAALRAFTSPPNLHVPQVRHVHGHGALRPRALLLCARRGDAASCQVSQIVAHPTACFLLRMHPAGPAGFAHLPHSQHTQSALPALPIRRQRLARRVAEERARLGWVPPHRTDPEHPHHYHAMLDGGHEGAASSSSAAYGGPAASGLDSSRVPEWAGGARNPFFRTRICVNYLHNNVRSAVAVWRCPRTGRCRTAVRTARWGTPCMRAQPKHAPSPPHAPPARRATAPTATSASLRMASGSCVTTCKTRWGCSLGAGACRVGGAACK